MKFNLPDPSSSLNQIKAANELVEGKTINHSKQGAQPLRSTIRTEGMSSNLQGQRGIGNTSLWP
jgi:hypothetical protein